MSVLLVLRASPLGHGKGRRGDTSIRDRHLLARSYSPLRDEDGPAAVDMGAGVGDARMVRHSETGVEEDGVVAEVRVVDVEHVCEELVPSAPFYDAYILSPFTLLTRFDTA